MSYYNKYTLLRVHRVWDIFLGLFILLPRNILSQERVV
jgi:hypothetical protein